MFIRYSKLISQGKLNGNVSTSRMYYHLPHGTSTSGHNKPYAFLLFQLRKYMA